MPERLFDYYASPVLIVLLHQFNRGQMFYDRSKEIRGGGQIEEKIAVGGVILIDFLQRVLQLGIYILVIELAAYVIHALAKPLDDVLVDTPACIVLHIGRDLLPKLIGGHSPVGQTHDGKFAR